MANAEQAVKVPEAPKPEKQPRPVLQTVFPSEQALLAEVEKRTKGPRRSFKCTHGSKTLFVAANNEGRAGGVAFMEVGGQVEEIGKKPRAPKVMGVDGILQAVNGLSEADRTAVLAQLKAALAKGGK